MAVCELVGFSLSAAFTMAALGSAAAAGAPAGPPPSPCSDARSLFMSVVTLTAFCNGEDGKVTIWLEQQPEATEMSLPKRYYKSTNDLECIV